MPVLHNQNKPQLRAVSSVGVAGWKGSRLGKMEEKVLREEGEMLSKQAGSMMGSGMRPRVLIDPRLRPRVLIDPRTRPSALIDPRPRPRALIDPRPRPMVLNDPRPRPRVLIDPRPKKIKKGDIVLQSSPFAFVILSSHR